MVPNCTFAVLDLLRHWEGDGVQTNGQGKREPPTTESAGSPGSFREAPAQRGGNVSEGPGAADRGLSLTFHLQAAGPWASHPSLDFHICTRRRRPNNAPPPALFLPSCPSQLNVCPPGSGVSICSPSAGAGTTPVLLPYPHPQTLPPGIYLGNEIT